MGTMGTIFSFVVVVRQHLLLLSGWFPLSPFTTADDYNFRYTDPRSRRIINQRLGSPGQRKAPLRKNPPNQIRTLTRCGMVSKAETRIEQWPVDKLIFYARNPRKNDAAVDRMSGSIREFGFKIPVLARSDGEVVDGHLRL